ncbi:hypothetical protein H2199_002630 [Coniosporium tulheliwenetii]|uniref:Uncharacterized protein n=1 Tax=Coniosporium tulheliwenetii TaxID=3383036 RepID=A0ACC2ZH09_9PEZI|nr:hypothetical protein H2199_002630 [Cladosporium sp. JES 115]
MSHLPHNNYRRISHNPYNTYLNDENWATGNGAPSTTLTGAMHLEHVVEDMEPLMPSTRSPAADPIPKEATKKMNKRPTCLSLIKALRISPRPWRRQWRKHPPYDERDPTRLANHGTHDGTSSETVECSPTLEEMLALHRTYSGPDLPLPPPSPSFAPPSLSPSASLPLHATVFPRPGTRIHRRSPFPHPETLVHSHNTLTQLQRIEQREAMANAIRGFGVWLRQGREGREEGPTAPEEEEEGSERWERRGARAVNEVPGFDQPPPNWWIERSV